VKTDKSEAKYYLYKVEEEERVGVPVKAGRTVRGLYRSSRAVTANPNRRAAPQPTARQAFVHRQVPRRDTSGPGSHPATLAPLQRPG
jgi:hypothetical protein